MNGAAVSIDVFFALWHDCRRCKEDIALMGDVAELSAEARAQYNDTAFDLVGTVTNVTSILNAIQAEIGTTILNLGPRGVIRVPYARCTDTPPFFNPVQPAEYNATAALIDQLIDAVTVAVA